MDSVRIRYSKFSRVYFAGETIWSGRRISWNYYWKSMYCGLVQTICNLSNGIPCSCKKYFRKYMVYLLLGIGYIALTYWLNAQIHLSNAYLLFLVRGIVSVSVPILLSCALFYRTTEFDAIKTLTIRLVRGTAARLHSRREDSNG